MNNAFTMALGWKLGLLALMTAHATFLVVVSIIPIMLANKIGGKAATGAV